MKPFFADAIDIPAVLIAGMIVLVPLMAFEVFAEAFVLKFSWKQPFGRLCKFTLIANTLSLLAGIPTLFLNAAIDGWIIPPDLPGFFSRYPVAAAIDSLIYFIVTVLVEGAYAVYWNSAKGNILSRKCLWRGILLANLASYAVVAPLNYLAVRPYSKITEFTHDTRWTGHPSDRMLFIDSSDHYLKSIRLDGSDSRIVVPAPMDGYLISTNQDACLFHATTNAVIFFRANPVRFVTLWKTDERFDLNHVAFSPSGAHAAFAGSVGDFLEIIDLTNGHRSRLTLLSASDVDTSVAWSTNESVLLVRSIPRSEIRKITIAPSGELSSTNIARENLPPLYVCYGNAGETSPNNRDIRKDFTADTLMGLDSGLKIDQNSLSTNETIFNFSPRPGLLHIASFQFSNPALLAGCQECLFEANDYIYLLDIPGRRVGTLVEGSGSIFLTPHYQKKF